MGGKGVHISLTLDDRDASAMFARLARKVADMTPVMQDVSEILVDESKEAFEREADPETGKPWAPWAPATIRARKRMGKYPGEILALHGHLKGSIHGEAGPDFAAAGSDAIYAAAHQLGADFSIISTRAHVEIPARPFLGVSPEGWDEIEQTALAYLTR